MRKYFLTFLMAVIVSACDAPKTVEKKVNVYNLEVTYSKVGEDPRCSCSQSRAAFITNNDPMNARYSKTRVDVLDANAPSTVIDTFIKEVFVPSKGNEFLGCAIESVSGGPACGRLNKFTIEHEVVIKGNSDKRLTALGLTYSPSIASCAAICKIGSPDCLALGAEMLPLASPILAMVKAAGSGNTSKIVSKDEVLRPYGADVSKDVCQRTDLVVSPTEIRNSSSLPDKFCEISVGDKSAFKLPVSVRATIPRDLVATRGSSEAKAFGAMRLSGLLEFSSIETAPAYAFRDTQTDQIDPDLTRRFGGSIISSAQVDDMIVVATSNGCLSFPAP